MLAFPIAQHDLRQSGLGAMFHCLFLTEITKSYLCKGTSIAKPSLVHNNTEKSPVTNAEYSMV